MDIDRLNRLLSTPKKRESSSAKKRIFAQYYNNQIKALGDSEKTFIESQNNYMDNWSDDAGLKLHTTKSTDYYNKVNSIRDMLTQNADLSREVLGDESYYKVYNALGDILKNKDNVDKYITSQSELYKKYQNADEYNKAKQQFTFDKKYGGIKYFEDFKKSPLTQEYRIKTLPKEEQDYLRQKGFFLEYSELYTQLPLMKERFNALENALSRPTSQLNASQRSKLLKEKGELGSRIKKAEERLKGLNSLGGEYAGLVNQILSSGGELAFDQRWGGSKKAYEDYKKEAEEKRRLDKALGRGEYYTPTPDEMTPEEKSKVLAGKKVQRKREDEYALEIDPIFDESRFNGEGVSEILEYYAEPEEKELHAFLKKTKGEVVANRYLEELRIAKLDKRLNQAIFTAAYEYGSKSPFTASVSSVKDNLLSGLEFATDTLGSMNNPYAPINNNTFHPLYRNNPRSTYASKAQGKREGVKSQIDSDTWDFIYDVGMSAADSLTAAGISAVVPFAGEALLGGSAAASAYNEALDRGLSGGDAVLTAVTSGLAESVFEHMSIGKILDVGDITKGFTKAGLKQTVKKVASDMFVNFSEESLTELSNIVTDQLINGELSNYAFSVREYMSQGMTEDEARKKAAADIGEQIGLSGLSGALMGFFFGAGGSIKGMRNSSIANSRSGSIIKQNGNILELKELAANSGIADIQKSAEGLTDLSKPSKIGYVYNSLIDNAVDNSIKQMTPILLENGATKSGSNSAQGWARQIATSVLNPNADNRLLFVNKVTKDVYTDFVENGKYGGDKLVALRDMADLGNQSNKFGPGYVTQQGNIINEQGVEVPMTDYSSGQTKTLADVYGESVANRLEAERPNPRAKTEADIQAEKQAYFDKYFAKEKQITPEEEKHLKEFGESKGLEVEFVDGAVNDIGYGVFENGKKIVISRYAKQPMRILFKHEFTHSVEKAKGYKRFQEYVLKESEAFKEWLATKGFEDDSAAIKDMMERYKGKVDYNKVDTDSTDKKDNNYEKAKADVIADFVGEFLFGDNVDKNGNPIKIDTNFLVELKRKDRNLFNRFVEWVHSILKRLTTSGVVNKDIIRLEQKFKRLAETARQQRAKGESEKSEGEYSLPDVDKTKKSVYNEFRTQAMIWANSASTNVGDTKIFNRNGKNFVLLESTEDGYVEIASGNYKELRAEYERLYSQENRGIYGHFEEFRSEQGGNFLNLQSNEDGTNDVGNSRPFGSQKLQDDSAGNNEHLQSSNKGISITEADSIDEPAYSLPNDSYNIPEIARGKNYDELRILVDEGKITKDDAMAELSKQFGRMPQGESPKVDVTVPNKVSEKQGVRRFARTALESGHLTDGMSEEAKREILDGALNYKILSNNKLVRMAEYEVKNDINKAIKKWEDLVESGRMPTAKEIVLGEVLMVEAAKAGNANDVAMYLAELSAMGTELGQGIQALSLLKKLSGVGQLHYVSRVIAQLNEDLKSRYGDKYLDKMVKLNPYQEKMLAESKDESEIESIIDDILTDVARQLPSTWRDKLNAWRYLAMLGNVKTHLRNFFGNGVFMPAIRLKNTLASVAEKIIIRDEANRTKSFKLKKEYKNFAEADFKNVEDLISKGGKMSPSSIVDERRKIFTSKAFGWLENARQFNFNMLEKEDMYFLKRHYKVALASVLQSRGINLNNVTDEQLQSARNYAIKEAQKATYRDFSYFANMLNKLANPNKNGNGWDALRAVGGVLVEGAVPFKKTPINVLKRGVEYSPIGIATSLANSIRPFRDAFALKKTAEAELAKNNEDKANEYFEMARIKNGEAWSGLIDGLSASASGTMILGLGMLLQSIGWITGGLGYDDDDALERMSGAQPYSLNFGEVINDLAGVVGIDADVDNYSLTIDWMAPSSLPLLIGAEIQKANEEAENFNFFDALATIGEPMTELSFLQGISDVIDGIAYSGADSLGTMGEVATNLASSYLSQYIPTLSGQTARTLDESRRTNFIDKDSIVPKSIQKVWQKTLGKIPFAANAKVPYIDAWGKVDKEDNIALRAFENFLSPTYISKIEDDKVNKELAKVYADTKDSGIIPKRASTSFSINGVTKNLTPEEYVKYATNRGQYSRRYVETVMGNSMYQGLSSENKAEAISFLLSFANAKAKSDVSDYDYTSVSTYKSAAKFEMAGIDVTSYAIAKAAMRKENADTDGSGSVDKDERKEALEKAGFNRRERNKFLDIYYSNYEDILDDYGE